MSPHDHDSFPRATDGQGAPSADPGLKVPDSLPIIACEGGFVHVTCKEGHRLSIATTIESLINMLDGLDGDPDAEPYLGAPERHPGGFGGHPSQVDAWQLRGNDDREEEDEHRDDADLEPTLGAAEEHPSAGCGPRRSKEGGQGDWFNSISTHALGEDEPSLGVAERHPVSFEAGWMTGELWERSGILHVERGGRNSQEKWAEGGDDDEREDVSEDEGAQDDREDSLGWQDEGNQVALHNGRADYEVDLGSTEEIDQVRRAERQFGAWLTEHDEPSLGWSGHGTGCRDDEPTDDREGDDERECDGDEGDYSGGEADAPGFIAGGNEAGERSVWFGDSDGAVTASAAPLVFTGDGRREAKRLLKGVKADKSAPRYVERAQVMPDGTIFRTFVPRR